MEEQKKNVSLSATAAETSGNGAENEENVPLDKNVRLMSPTQMVLRRFFRSKLSIVGLALIVGLFLFCWLGPLVYNEWEQGESDDSGKIE
ncbi:MAG: hypothetical protein J6B77_09595, partial [Clostridia bacterium]|nr:hypothetical protein [Clostridia bacterium]